MVHRPSFGMFALFVVAATVGVACSGSDSAGISTPTAIPAEQLVVAITPKFDSLRLGASRDYNAAVTTRAGETRSVPVTWSSLTPALVTVSGGTVTAVASGEGRIVAQAGASADTATVVVTTAGFSLQLTPSAVAATLGDTVQFQARLVDAAGSSFVVPGVEWTSSDSSVAQFVGDGRIAFVGEGTLDVIGSADGMRAIASVTAAEAAVGSITINPSSASTSVGESVALRAEVRDRRGRMMPSHSLSWTVSDASVATIDNTGNVRGVSRGGVIVTAKSGDKVATASVNVAGQAAAAVSLELTHDTVAFNTRVQAVATPRDLAGAPVLGRVVSYQSSNPGVATVNNSGLIVPLVSGVTNISAICDGHIATVRLTVYNPRVASLSIVPSAPTLSPGSSAPLTALVVDQMGQGMPNTPVTWISQSPAVATVSPAGVISGVSIGASNVSATAGGITSLVTATVSPQVVASVQVTPSTISLQVGASTTLSAMALSAANQPIGGASFSWSSSNTSVATVSALGVVSAKAAGSGTITVASGSKSAVVSLTVTAAPPVPVATIGVSVNSASLAIGQSTQAVATLYDAQGNTITGRAVAWSSANPSVASVTASGLITAMAAGSASISAASGGQTGLTAISVVTPAPAPVATITVNAPTSTLQVGQTSQLTVSLRDVHGNVLTGRTLLYNSTDASVATVSPSGLVTAGAAGAATVTVTSEGQVDELAFTVSQPAPPPPTLTALMLSPESVSLTVGATTQFNVAGMWSDGSSAAPAVTYSATGGTINSIGLYTAGATPGSYRAIATAQGASRADTSRIVITGPLVTLLELILTPASVTLAPGDTAQFSVAGVWSDGSTSAPAVTLSATGGATSPGGSYIAGSALGVYRVIAMQQGGGGADTSIVNIVPAPVAAVSVSPSPVRLFAGQAVQLSATLRDGKGGVLVGRAVTWASSNTQVATVSPSGLVTAVSAGSVHVSATSEGRTQSASVIVQAAGASTTIYPGDDIQAAVNKFPLGTTFHIKAGVHRLQQVIPKGDDKFVGDPGAILSGAKLLTAFTRIGGYWVVTGQTQEGTVAGVCEAGKPRCSHPEDLFIDDVPLLHVESIGEVEPGKWFFDYSADRIYFADDPTGRRVEISVAPSAFYGAIRDVTISGLVIEKYATPAQKGAIDGTTSARWIVSNNEVRLNHGLGIRVGAGMQVSGNRVHHQGQLGIGGGGADVIVENNEIGYNNTAGFSWYWEAGGTKFAYTTRLVVRGNYSHHNHGPGLWTDINNINTLYENNRVDDNDGQGILHEISYAAVIRNNSVSRNGWGAKNYLTWPEGSGILVNSSPDIEVVGNTLTGNANGIGAIQSTRGSGLYGPYLVQNLFVHDNVIIQPMGMTGVVQDVGDDAVFTQRNNRFEGNTYRLGTNRAPFRWLNGPRTAAEWLLYGNDVNGSFLP